MEELSRKLGAAPLRLDPLLDVERSTSQGVAARRRADKRSRISAGLSDALPPVLRQLLRARVRIEQAKGTLQPPRSTSDQEGRDEVAG